MTTGSRTQLQFGGPKPEKAKKKPASKPKVDAPWKQEYIDKWKVIDGKFPCGCLAFNSHGNPLLYPENDPHQSKPPEHGFLYMKDSDRWKCCRCDLDIGQLRGGTGGAIITPCPMPLL